MTPISLELLIFEAKNNLLHDMIQEFIRDKVRLIGGLIVLLLIN